MTKRSDGKFSRNPRDYYTTPAEAVVPLIPWLTPGSTFDEPMAGNGALIDALESQADIMCVGASDILPMRHDIEQCDVYDLTDTCADQYITNPMWETKLKGVASDMQPLHRTIRHLSDIKPTWLLFGSDWAHTRQARHYADRCRAIVSVGRLSWMQNGTSGFDNCSWYLFDKPSDTGTYFHWRTWYVVTKNQGCC